MNMPAEKIACWYDIIADAQNGMAEAQAALGVALSHGTDGFVVNIPKALEWHTQAAKQGHVASQFALAEIYATAGEMLDMCKAAYWYERAAEGGYIPAKEKLGQLKEEELGRKLQRLKQQAETGDSGSQYALGKFYRKAGKFRNIQLARSWLTKSAEQNNAEAQYALGELYALEEEIQNLLLARCWYEKAAVVGHEKAGERVEVIDLCLKQETGETLTGNLARCSRKKRHTFSRLLVSLWHALDAANFVVAYSLMAKLKGNQEV